MVKLLHLFRGFCLLFCKVSNHFSAGHLGEGCFLDELSFDPFDKGAGDECIFGLQILLDGFGVLFGGQIDDGIFTLIYGVIE